MTVEWKHCMSGQERWYSGINMYTIYKYPLALTDKQVVEMQYPANILSVIEQSGEIVVYAIADRETSLTKEIAFYIAGTGSNIDDFFAFNFLGTVKVGQFVWHVFWRDGK